MKIEGPVLLASTHIDIPEKWGTSTEHTIISEGNHHAESLTRTTTNPMDIEQLDQTSVQYSSTTKIINRQKSISENVILTSTLSSATSSPPSNNESDGFHTENYEITDLFPNLRTNKTQSLPDTKDDSITQIHEER